MPSVDIYDSWELVSRHMPIEQPPATASYIIFKKGNKTYAKNGVYGHIECEDTDAATVIQYAIDQLHPNGGLIYLTRDTYEMHSGITVSAPHVNLTIAGNKPILKAMDDIDIITLAGVESWEDSVRRVRISGLHFIGYGSSHTKSCIKSDNAVTTMIDNCYFEEMYTGIHMINLGHDEFITKNVFRYAYGRGILSETPGLHVVDNLFSISKSASEGAADKKWITLTQHATVIGNWFEHLYGSAADSIYVAAASASIIVGNRIASADRNGIVVYGESTIVGNIIDNNGDKGVYIGGDNILLVCNNIRDNTNYGVHIGSTASDCMVIGNVLRNNGTDILDEGSNTAIRDNRGYGEHTVPTSAPSTPIAGSIYFDTSTGTLYIYDGTAWKSVTLS